MKSKLTENGFSISEATTPAYHPASDTNPFGTPSPHSGDDSSSSNSVTIDLTEMLNIEAQGWCSVTAALENPKLFEPPTISPSQLMDEPFYDTDRTLRNKSPGNYGRSPAFSPQAAIDFVLEYVHSCFCKL